MFKSLDDVFNLYEICKFTAFSGRKDTLSCKWTRTQNHLFHKRTLNHLTKLAYWPNSWEFVYELNGSGFESSCSHLNFRFCACFEEWVPWHSSNYRVWIHSEMRVTWRQHTVKSICIFDFFWMWNHIKFIKFLKGRLNLNKHFNVWVSFCWQHMHSCNN